MPIVSNISRFNSALASYIAAQTGRKSVDAIIEAKGTNIGIGLYKEFADQKWGGPGRKVPGLAHQEFKARVARGAGIRIRQSFLAEYLGQRNQLRARARDLRNPIGPQNRSTLRANASARTRNEAARRNLWNAVVGRELGARQRGIGVLAAAYLWRRSRSNNARGTYYVRNRTGRYVLGFVERAENSFRIVAEAAGASVVDSRYGIVDRVLARETADIEQYFTARPEYWQFWQTFNGVKA